MGGARCEPHRQLWGASRTGDYGRCESHGQLWGCECAIVEDYNKVWYTLLSWLKTASSVKRCAC